MRIRQLKEGELTDDQFEQLTVGDRINCSHDWTEGDGSSPLALPLSKMRPMPAGIEAAE
jgi:hypothetical protein